jgi:hypothetical protein
MRTASPYYLETSYKILGYVSDGFPAYEDILSFIEKFAIFLREDEAKKYSDLRRGRKSIFTRKEHPFLPENAEGAFSAEQRGNSSHRYDSYASKSREFSRRFLIRNRNGISPNRFDCLSIRIPNWLPGRTFQNCSESRPQIIYSQLG